MSNTTSIIGLGRYTDAPVAAPIASVALSPGDLNGSYQYAISYFDELGETTLSPASPALHISGAARLTDIPVGPAYLIGRKIYRTKASGSAFFLAAVIKNNTSTAFVDTLADNKLTTPSLMVSTNATNEIMDGYLKYTRPPRISQVNIIADPITPPLIDKEATFITGGTGSVRLLSLNAGLSGLRMMIVNISGATITVLPAVGQTINDGPSVSLVNNASAILLANDNVAWQSVPMGTSGGGNPFDQDLNTTNSPTFDGLTIADIYGAGFGDVRIRNDLNMFGNPVKNATSYSAVATVPGDPMLSLRSSSGAVERESLAFGDAVDTAIANDEQDALVTTVSAGGVTTRAYSTNPAHTMTLSAGGTIVAGLPTTPGPDNIVLRSDGTTTLLGPAAISNVTSAADTQLLTIDGSGTITRRAISSIAHESLAGGMAAYQHLAIDTMLDNLYLSTAVSSKNLEMIDTRNILTASPEIIFYMGMAAQSTDLLTLEVVGYHFAANESMFIASRTLLRCDIDLNVTKVSTTNLTVSQEPSLSAVVVDVSILPEGLYAVSITGTGAHLRMTTYARIIRADLG